VALSHELARAADAAAAFATDGESLEAVLAAEPYPDRRLYLCSFASGSEPQSRTWLVVDADGSPVSRRDAVRDAVSVAALAEIAADTAAGGDLDALLRELDSLEQAEPSADVAGARAAAVALRDVVGEPPRVATPAYLDDVGAATRRLELALGEGASPFATAMAAARAAVEALTAEVEAGYKRELT
jgi:hypothetical protein